LISLPTDKTLWKTASAGFGLICGVAVIALMNQLNYLFYPVPDGTESEIAKAYFSDTFLLTGKLIAIIAGCFLPGPYPGSCIPVLRKSLQLVSDSYL
jgi:hypothetical protein